MSTQNLPGFLIIGAMKAGTTTLYEDLSYVPGLYLPPEKEPEDLVSPDVETSDGLARYAAKFANAPEGALCGEASTAYTKLPTYKGVPDRALRILGPNLKIIYMTRDPVRRIVSQYHHLWGLGLENRPMKEALLEDETYVSYSDYERQLEPWRRTFPHENILSISFESYISSRSKELLRVCDFLGVSFPGITTDTHRNASNGKRVVLPGSKWSKIAHSKFYLYQIKPLVPTKLRDKAKRYALPKARKMTDELDEETKSEIVRRLGV